MKIAELYDLFTSGYMFFYHYSDIGKKSSDKFCVEPYCISCDEPLRQEYKNFNVMQIEHSTVGIIVYFDYPDY